jgi:hypothetical protein
LWWGGYGVGGGKERSVRGLVYTARVLVAARILSIYEGMGGNSQKLEENGGKKRKKKEKKCQKQKEKRKKVKKERK